MKNEADIALFAEELIEKLGTNSKHATVVGLSGELGAGKTTLTKKIANHLSISEEILSPTFVIAKYYPIPNGKWSELVHIDAYRIEDERELLPLRFAELLTDPQKLIIIEWPEKIKGAYPKYSTTIQLTFVDEVTRYIETKNEL